MIRQLNYGKRRKKENFYEISLNKNKYILKLDLNLIYYNKYKIINY